MTKKSTLSRENSRRLKAWNAQDITKLYQAMQNSRERWYIEVRPVEAGYRAWSFSTFSLPRSSYYCKYYVRICYDAISLKNFPGLQSLYRSSVFKSKEYFIRGVTSHSDAKSPVLWIFAHQVKKAQHPEWNVKSITLPLFDTRYVHQYLTGVCW